MQTHIFDWMKGNRGLSGFAPISEKPRSLNSKKKKKKKKKKKFLLLKDFPIEEALEYS